MFAKHADEWIQELLLHEGLGPYYNTSECPICREEWNVRSGASQDNHVGRNGEGVFQCEDCDGGQLACGKCMLESHQQLPLHRLKVSPTLFFNYKLLLSA